ncbi:TRAP transporter small permease [Roseomonas eburnea]|uniref:TRAP transporter small permease protein n=1 Tax=Neoroseomonas eburnea TaxID=1346889 RepID=A0A9X9XAF5_9PROT|nr:TRAP transporter small permease [Neoroseomonas eburnea]MBR0680691.1 TRAP transporter small permease [Neoroseomonas eburnea]
MSTPEPPRGPIAHLATLFALGGGCLLLAVAVLTTVSVLLRWLTSQPVTGDVELVQIGGGLAVLGFLAYGTLMRANIFVDSFTTRLPRRLNQALDGFWNLVWGVAALVLAERMTVGAQEALFNRTTTFGLLGIPIWWAVAAGALGFAATGIAALHWSWRLARGRG